MRRRVRLRPQHCPAGAASGLALLHAHCRPPRSKFCRRVSLPNASSRAGATPMACVTSPACMHQFFTMNICYIPMYVSHVNCSYSFGDVSAITGGQSSSPWAFAWHPPLTVCFRRCSLLDVLPNTTPRHPIASAPRSPHYTPQRRQQPLQTRFHLFTYTLYAAPSPPLIAAQRFFSAASSTQSFLPLPPTI